MNYREVYTSKVSWSPEEDLLLNMAVGFTNNYVGYDFFNDTCSFISKTLGINNVMIAKVTSSTYKHVSTVGLCHNGEVLPPYTYELKDTPCEHVLFNRICFYPDQVQEIFPQDQELKELGIRSYMGIALADRDDNCLGLIALMNEKLLVNPDLAEVFITIVSPRVEEELLQLEEERV